MELAKKEIELQEFYAEGEEHEDPLKWQKIYKEKDELNKNINELTADEYKEMFAREAEKQNKEVNKDSKERTDEEVSKEEELAWQEHDDKEKSNERTETEEEKDAIKKANEDNSELLKHMKEEIGDVSEVKFSNKLKKHPVCLTTKGDVSIEMQKVFDAMPNDMGIKAEKVLEINEKHQIAEKLKYLYENDKEEFDKYTKILYAEAKMIAGLPIENPTEISTLICEVISK